MYKRIILILILSLVLIIIACPGIQNGNSDDVYNTGQLNEKPSSLSDYNKIKEAFKKYLYEFSSFEEERELTFAPEDNLKNSVSISKDNARKDIDFLFKSLKYSYACYRFFGGDGTFDEAKGKIAKEIEGYEQDINIKDLANLIYQNLKFIQDSHFSVENRHTCGKYKYLNNDEYMIGKDNKGYYVVLSGQKYYITSINGSSEINKFIKPTIAQNGDISYNFGFLDLSGETMIKVVFEGKDERLIYDIKLSYKASPEFEKTGFRKYTRSGVNIIENRRFYRINSAGDELDDFLEDSYTVSGQDLIVYDIRGNPGGDGRYPYEWFRNVTGQSPAVPSAICYLNTATVLWRRLNYLENDIAEQSEAIQETKAKTKAELSEFINGDKKEGWGEIYVNEEVNHKNDTKIIVLVDHNVGSSGELFMQYLSTMENVIFVGTNTSGAQLCGDVYGWRLPHSGIKINSGTFIRLPLDLENIDGRGYEPDFWVNSPDIMDRILLFIEKHQLN